MGKIKEAGKGTVKGIAIFVMAFLFAVLFYLFCSGFFNYKDAAFLYSMESFPVIGILCAVALLFFLLLHKITGDILQRCGKRTLKIVCICLVSLALAVQCYFLFYVRSYYKWDSGFVIGAAASLAERGRVSEEALYYMSVYPNQNAFVLITAALVRLGNLLGVAVADRPLFFNLFNTVCLDLSVFLVFPILKKIRPNLENWQFCRVLLILLLNPFLYVGVSYYYTITLSLPLSQGFLYLMLSLFGESLFGTEEREKTELGKEHESKMQLFKMILAGIFLGAGFELRATAVIFAIGALAVGIWMLIEGKCEKRGGFAAALCIMTATAILTGALLSALQRNYVGIDTKDTAFPASHWVMMSLTMPGSHNGEDEAYTASFSTKEQKEEAVKDRMKEKLSAMDLKEYLILIKTKVKNTFGTGMNGYTTFLADALRTNGIYEGVFGSRRDMTVLWHQGYHLFMLLGILLAVGRFIYCFIREKEIDFYIFLQALILFGAILFYVFWEASEQYSVPFMMLMCSLGLTGYLDRDRKETEKKETETKETKKKGAEERKAEGKRTKGKERTVKGHLQSVLWSALSFGAAVFILIFGICRYEAVTNVLYTWSHPVAVQILANGSCPVDDGAELVQELALPESFNHLVVQWRNPQQENSTAVYRLSLKEEGSGQLVFEEEIRAAGTPYNGAGIYDFGEVSPKDGAYELKVEKTAGDPEDDLEFVVYDMYGYQPYPAGNLYLNKNGEIEEMTASLLFSVSREYEGSYMGKIKYVIFVSLLFLIFLFMGFWCKLNMVWSYRGGKRND